MRVVRTPIRIISEMTIDADIDMGGYKLTGLGSPTAQDHSVRYGRAEIRNNEINLAAGIAYSKLNLTGAVKAADIIAAASIPLSKLVSTVCSETEADGKITTHEEDASAHHVQSPVIVDAGVDYTEVDKQGNTYLLAKTFTLLKMAGAVALKVLVGFARDGISGTGYLDIRVNDASKVEHTSTSETFAEFYNIVDISGEDDGALTVKLYLKNLNASYGAKQRLVEIVMGRAYT